MFESIFSFKILSFKIYWLATNCAMANIIGILLVTCLISALILSMIVTTAAPISSQKLTPDDNSIDSN